MVASGMIQAVSRSMPMVDICYSMTIIITGMAKIGGTIYMLVVIVPKIYSTGSFETIS